MPLHAEATEVEIKTTSCCHAHHAPEPDETEEDHCGLCDLTHVAVDIPQLLVLPLPIGLFTLHPIYIQQLTDLTIEAPHQARAPPFMTV